MSDDFFLDEYDLDWEPHSAADELVERTIHSPVLTSYTAALEWLSDWDSDDFDDSEDEYDNFTKLSRGKDVKEDGKDGRSKETKQNVSVNKVKIRRTNVRQPVLWKSWRERLPSPELPIWKDGQHPKSSLLKDWRQRMQATNEPANPSKSGKGRSRPGRKGARTKPPPASEPSIEEDEAFLDDADLVVSELPPLVLHAGGDPEPKQPPRHGYLNGTTSSLARQAITQASNDEKAIATQGKKRKPSDPPDANGYVHDTFKPKRGRPAKDVVTNRDTDTTNDKAPSKKSHGEGEQALKKGTRGRPKGSPSTAKAASTVASKRSMRDKVP